MSEEESGECLRPLLVHRVAGALDDHDATVGNRPGKATRRCGIAVVELAGNEAARNFETVELAPDRVHRARPHTAKRSRKTGNVIVHARRTHLSGERWASAFQTFEHGQAAPVVDKGLEAIGLNALSQRLIAASPYFARILVQAGMSSDGEERQESFRPGGRNVKRKAAAHGVTDQMRTLNSEAVPEPLQIFCAGVHRVWRARPDLGRAMAAEVGEHPLPAGRHQGNDFVPGPAALGEAMEERNRRAIADHLIVEPNVISHFENHK